MLEIAVKTMDSQSRTFQVPESVSKLYIFQIIFTFKQHLVEIY